jgi:HtrA serine peptidase 2
MGRVLSFDEMTDVALIKIDTPEPLPTVALGSSSSLRAGEWVVALGSPLHLQNTVTAGVISAVGRSAAELGLPSNNEYIQTDAAINVGNSGGPLLNLDGEVIGINTMKAIASGISFALPIDRVKEVVALLTRHGRVVRPFIGIKMLSLTPALLQQLGQVDESMKKVSGGVLVADVRGQERGWC